MARYSQFWLSILETSLKALYMRFHDTREMTHSNKAWLLKQKRKRKQNKNRKQKTLSFTFSCSVKNIIFEIQSSLAPAPALCLPLWSLDKLSLWMNFFFVQLSGAFLLCLGFDLLFVTWLISRTWPNYEAWLYCACISVDRIKWNPNHRGIRIMLLYH